jgi:hypothetical protein
VARFLKLAFFGVCLAGAFELSIPGGLGPRVLAQTDAMSVVVVNGPDMPIPTSNGRVPWQQWTLIKLQDSDYRSEPVYTVPRGFRLFITDVNFDGCTSQLREAIGSNLTIWPEGYVGDPNIPPDDEVIPKNALMLAKRGVFRRMAHWGTSQQPNIFVNEGQAVWAEVYRSMGKGSAEARVWVSGYLVPMTGGPAPW